MTYAGPWITPTTTHFAQACADPPAVPSLYRRAWESGSWDTVRFGGGTGPTDTLLVYGDTITNLAVYDTNVSVDFVLSQVLQAYPLSATPGAKLVPYYDVPFPPDAISVEYESPVGVITAAPHTKCIVNRVPSNNGLAANIDFYQLPSAPAAYTFLDPTALTANAGNLLASLPTFSSAGSGGIFTGKQMASPTDTVVYLAVMHGQDVTPFPYFDGVTVLGFVGIPEVLPMVEYVGPRFRFIYAGRPPLAHRQRRDGTATAGAQLAHIGTTGSRPSLAWRQNNP